MAKKFMEALKEAKVVKVQKFEAAAARRRRQNPEGVKAIKEWFVAGLNNKVRNGLKAAGIIGSLPMPEIVGDRNFYKDIFDVTVPTGMNVLMVPHAENEDKNVFSSAQMWMKLFRCAVEAMRRGVNPMLVLKALDEVIKTAIDYTIDKVTDLDGRCDKGYRGFEEIDASYTQSILMGLNSGALNMWPSLIKGATSDIARTLAKHVQLDRYFLDGHTAMISIDPAYEMLKAKYIKKLGKKQQKEAKKMAVKKGILQVSKNFIKVYDPRANRFFDENNVPKEERYGVFMKYPSVGTRETVIVLFMDDDDINEAILNLVAEGEITEEEAIILAEQYANVKEGIVEMPGDLAAIARLLAGADRDGDKVSVILHCAGCKDIPWFLKEYGFRPLAVDIVPTKPREHGERYGVNMEMFSTNFHMITANHNEKVGPVTNGGRIEIQPLCVVDWTEATKQLFISCFCKVWEAGSEANEEGADGKYHTPFTWSEDEYGNEVASTEPKAFFNGKWVAEASEEELIDAYHAFEKAVHMTRFEGTVEEQWDTLLEILKDFDVLIRHTQECVIDAEKKFYKVYTDFVTAMRDVMTITPLKFGAAFTIDWAKIRNNPEEVVKAELQVDDLIRKDDKVIILNMKGEIIDREGFRGVMAEEPIQLLWPAEKKDQEDRIVTVFPDFFAKYRRYAIQKSLKKLNELIDRYKTAIESSEFSAKREAALDNAILNIADRRVENRLQVAMSMGKSINSIYREDRKMIFAANADEYGDVSMSKQDAIRKALHEKYDDIYDVISNTVRWMVSRENSKVSPEDLIGYLAYGDDISTSAGSNMSKLLKEETAYAAIKLSQVQEAVEFIHARYNNVEALESLTAGQIIVVKDGEVYTNKMKKIADLYVSGNVMDGAYTVAMRDDSPALVRSLTDFITIPEVDRTRVAFELTLKTPKYVREDWDGVSEEGKWGINEEQVIINRALVDTLSARIGQRVKLTNVQDGNHNRLGIKAGEETLSGLFVNGSREGEHFNRKAVERMIEKGKLPKDTDVEAYVRKNYKEYTYDSAVKTFYEGMDGVVSTVYTDSICSRAMVVLVDVESRNAEYYAAPEIEEATAVTLDDVEGMSELFDIDF